MVTALALLFPTVARARPSPPPGAVTIDSIDAHGDGCATGTALASVSPDGEAFTVGFAHFSVDVGAGTAASVTAGCTLHFKVTVPPGWSYALARVEHVGFAALDAGVTATRRARFHLSGEAPEQAVVSTLSGPFAGDHAVDDAAGAPAYWSRCGKGKNLIITTEVSLERGDASAEGEITVDAIDGEVYHLVWQTCR